MSLKKNVKLVMAIVIVVLFLLFLRYDYDNISKVIQQIDKTSDNLLKARLWAAFGLGKIILIILIISFVLQIKKNNKIKRLQAKLNLWSKLSFHVSQIGEEVLNELPIGIVLIDVNNKEIQWLNPYANLILKNPEINTPLSQINESMLLLTEQETEKTIITLEKEKFECFYKKDLNVFYLFNASEKEEVKQLFRDKSLALAMITFDHLEESLIRYDISEQSQIKGEYLRALSDFIDPYEGYLKQLLDDRFLLLVNRQNLDKMIENKFSILDTVRKISHKYQLKVTLSMGIACWNVSYDKLAIYSQNAIELAQKRGGDQAVVNIENEKIQYFGAKIATLSKQSKVSVRVNTQNLVDIIKKYPGFYIMGHNYTDLDSLGSMIAFYKIVLSLKPDCPNYIILDKEKLDKSLLPVYHQLIQQTTKPLVEIITTEKAAKMIDENDVIVVVDTQIKDTLNSPELLGLTNNVIVIDHHRATEEVVPSIFSYVDPSASSTVELLVEIMGFLTEEIKIAPFEASVMYAGILIDTNAFIYRTSSRTFEVILKLKDFGADGIEVKSWLRKTRDNVDSTNALISKMEIFMGRFAIIKSDKIYDNRSFLAQVAEDALNISGIDAAFMVAKISNNRIAISARSYNQVNVQTIMEQMEGGGHFNSAATQITGNDIQIVIQNLKRLLKLELEYEKGDAQMEIILLTDIPNKGKKHDIIKVNNGYGNFLIQSQKALLSDKNNLAQIRKNEILEKQKKANYEALMKKLKNEIDNKTISLDIQVGPKGKIYGKITLKQIADEFKKIHHIIIDRKKISLENEITSVGIYHIDVNLTEQIKATFFLNVIERKNK
ncbi:Exopolyphosphatase-related protein [Candidatus Phytoplasma australiense]|uniref:Large ribosomal subunit protein bL9 n=1 Tax=Phytoplasma australiense TaxID=59748 RepID=B1V952_PHYAS|nr:Exopolyphosphatase-related protein [Candidatus Phytoplasma australiense]